MNAGAYNFEMSKVLGSVIALVDGKIKVFDNIKFGYRYSEFQDYANIVILQVEISLHSGNKPDIYARMQEVMNIRKDTQPLDKPSAGSIFKRLDGLIVSKEIERLGLKGEAIGGAKVSEKHAGFIINNGGASYTDVVELIDKIKDKFREIYDIELVEEIKYLGE